MALLNNIYVHVVDEDLKREIESTSYPTEEGIDIVDTIRKKPLEITLSGHIVDAGNLTAAEILSKIEQLRTNGTLITYVGRNVANNMQIQTFDTGHPNTIWGGCTFNMTLKEVRIVKNTAYQATKSGSTNAKASTKGKIQEGSIVVFKGGPVYVSSDATKAAAKRGRSTCTCTKINNKSWALHKYHLISKDGGKVYGWVDEKNIEYTIKAAKTNNTSESGTQQAKQGSSTAVYHKVKKGDTIWTLVNKTYKGTVNTTVDWVIKNNSHAFSRAGDAKTLQIGARILMGYKNS